MDQITNQSSVDKVDIVFTFQLRRIECKLADFIRLDSALSYVMPLPIITTNIFIVVILFRDFFLPAFLTLQLLSS